MTASWLMGVFVFAILIGDIRDIVGNARRNALSFQRHLDAITTYMNNNKVAKPVQVCFLENAHFLKYFDALKDTYMLPITMYYT